MAAATDPSSAALSPRFRRSGRNLPSPWSHVVRGEPDPASPSSPASPPPTTASIAPPETTDRSPPPPAAAAGAGASEGPEQPPPDGGDQGSAAAAWEKKSAWSRLSNGTAEAEPVMGAVSWPALSEATKASPKSSSSETLKALSDGSVFAPPAPVVSSPPPKQTANISNSNSSTNYASPARQKSGKRGGGTGSGGPIAGKGGAALPNGRSVPALTPPTSAETSQSSPGKVVNLEQPVRDLNNRAGSNWDHGPRGAGFPSQLHGGNEHQRSYGGNRRGNIGGGGSHHNPGNRRDQERGGGGGGGGYDWNHRSFGGGRDVQMQQRPQHQPRPMARPFVRPPPLVSAPFITSPPPRVSPFGGPLGYHDIPSPLFYLPPPPPPESLGGLPFVAPPAMFFAAPDPQLQSVLAKQIEYYFSPENLCKDIYLRQNMDGEGWVPISLIAGFNRVRNLTNNVQFILDTVKVSTVVEVQGDRIRRRNDWMNWPSLATTPNPPHSSATSNYDSLAARMRNVGLEENNSQTSTGNTVHTEAIHGSTSGESNRRSSMVTTSNGDGSGQSTVQTGSERSCLQEA